MASLFNVSTPGILVHYQAKTKQQMCRLKKPRELLTVHDTNLQVIKLYCFLSSILDDNLTALATHKKKKEKKKSRLGESEDLGGLSEGYNPNTLSEN